jgi:hypothetical protein
MNTIATPLASTMAMVLSWSPSPKVAARAGMLNDTTLRA